VLFQPRLKRLVHFPDEARPFLTDDLVYDDAAAAKHLKPELLPVIGEMRAAFARLPAFEKAALEAELRAAADRTGVKAGALIHATRVAVTGRAVSPGLFEVLELLGCARVVARLDAARDWLEMAGNTSAAGRD
jgi:glutamyl-tRNA synthetase